MGWNLGEHFLTRDKPLYGIRVGSRSFGFLKKGREMESSKFVSRLALGFFVSIFAVSCGGGGGGTTSTSTTSTTSDVQLTTIDELPSSLAPVEASTSSSLSLAKGTAYALAETGVRLDADPVEEGVLAQGSSMGGLHEFQHG